jgi:uncharacterized RDD family membrane protein YckC
MTQDNNYRPPAAEVADVHDQDADELATRWARVGGAFLDALIIGVILLPIMLATGYMQAAASGDEPPLLLQLQYSLLGLVVSAAVNGYMLHKYGQTVGKRVAGTRIVSVHDNSIQPLWRIYLLRYFPVNLIGLVPLAGPFLSIASVLFIFRSDRRCLHDLIAGTKVIRASAPWKRAEG